MKGRFGISLALFAVLLAAGCGGGGSMPPPRVTPTAGPASTAATMRIVIPPRPATTASARRAPKYISYATQSIKIVFTPAGGGSAITITQNLTPTSPGCQGNLSSSTTCTVQLPGLTPGTYSVDFSLYDGTLDNNTMPTGSELSATQNVPVTIRAGQDNVISVTLNGVPAAVAVLPGANSSLSGSQRSGYTISACFASEPAGTEGVTVVGLDADNNIIVGAGAPTPALTSSNTAVVTVSSPSQSAPNAFALQGSTSPANVGGSFALTASVTPLAGSPNTTPITANIPVSFVASGCPTPPPKASTSVSLTSSANPSVYGQSVTFTATVSVIAPGSGTPTGTVAFQDGGTNIASCAAQTVSGGVATCTISSLTVTPPTHAITAVFNGDANFNGSTSNTTTQVVNRAATAVALTSSGSPSVSGQSVTFTAAVSVTAPGAGTPTGTVSFQDGGVSIISCSARTVSAGQATCTTSVLGVGSHSITAVYSGDPNFNGSTSNTKVQNVGPAATTVSLTSNVNPSTSGQPVTFTATVTVNAPGSGTPTGTVSFTDGGSAIGCSSQALSSGQAVCMISTLSSGPHSITAVYNGDANDSGSSSTSYSQQVQ